jgi:hypothetical protein
MALQLYLLTAAIQRQPIQRDSFALTFLLSKSNPTSTPSRSPNASHMSPLPTQTYNNDEGVYTVYSQPGCTGVVTDRTIAYAAGCVNMMSEGVSYHITCIDNYTIMYNQWASPYSACDTFPDNTTVLHLAPCTDFGSTSWSQMCVKGSTGAENDAAPAQDSPLSVGAVAGLCAAASALVAAAGVWVWKQRRQQIHARMGGEALMEDNQYS